MSWGRGFGGTAVIAAAALLAAAPAGFGLEPVPPRDTPAVSAKPSDSVKHGSASLTGSFAEPAAWLDGRRLGTINAYIAEDGVAFIPRVEAIALLQGELSAAPQRAVYSQADIAREFIAVPELRARGIDIEYDASAAAVFAALPPETRIELTPASSVVVSAAAAAAASAPVRAEAANAEETRETAGGRGPGPDTFLFELPFNVDGFYVGDITTAVTLDGRAEISRARAAELLQGRMDPDAIAGFGLTPEPGSASEFIALETLQELGFEVVYDAAALAVNATLPRDARARQQVRLRPPRQEGPQGAIEPARVSSGVSVDLRPHYVFSDPNGETGFGDFRAEYRGFFAFGGFDGWQIAFDGEYDDGADERFVLDDVTVIKDDYENIRRYQAGSIRLRNASRFTMTGDVVGLSIERDVNSLRPFRNLRPSGATSFSLEREALVIVEVNGQTVATERLQAGEFDISDFPLASGANDVRVFVEDEFGRREVGAFDTYLDVQRLPAGETLYGFSAGLIPESGGASVWELSDDWSVSGFVEHGVSDNWTALGAIQTFNDQVELASAQRFSLPGALGALSLEGAVSTRDGDVGYAAGALYSWRSRQSAAVRHTVDIQHLYESAEFGISMSAGSALSLEDRQEFSARYGVNMRRWTGRAAVSRREQGDDVRTSYTLSAGYNWRAVSFDAQVQQETSGEEDETRLLFSVSRRFGENRLRGRHASEDNLYEAAWSRFGGREVGDWGGQVIAGTSDEADRVESRFNYVASRAEAEIQHTYRSDETGDLSEARGVVGFGLGVADGVIGFGRPFDNAFMVVRPHQSLDGRAVRVGSLGDSDLARTGALGPALLPIQSTYRTQRIRFDIDDLPAGYKYEPELEAFPSARAGYAVTVGSAANITVMGSLHGGDGEPSALKVGELVPVDGGPEAEGVQFFTNRTGRLIAEGLAPGRYRIVLRPDGTVVGEIEIPEDAGALFDFGRIFSGGV